MALPSAARRVGPTCLVALALFGCRQDPPPTLDGSTIHVPSSAAPERPRLVVTAVADCEERQVVSLRWNAALVADGPVDLLVDHPRRPLFATVDTPQKMLDLGLDGLTEAIKTIGLFRQKAKNVIRLSEILVNDYGGAVPSSRAALQSLPGVGR